MVTIEIYGKEHSTLEISDGFWDGWPDHPDKELHRKILEQSYLAVIARDENRIVGFVTVISDGVFTAYIPLLEVLPGYRGQGIAKGMLEKVFSETRELYMIDAVCDEELLPFYGKFGMQSWHAMIRRNYDRQSGRKS